jgi:hypothetical protein
MFKLIFRTVFLILFIIILIAGLAIWKGGEPFRWVGGKTEAVGKAIIHFGDIVDELKNEKKKAQKTLKRVKEAIVQEDNATKQNRSRATNKNKKAE